MPQWPLPPPQPLYRCYIRNLLIQGSSSYRKRILYRLFADGCIYNQVDFAVYYGIDYVWPALGHFQHKLRWNIVVDKLDARSLCCNNLKAHSVQLASNSTALGLVIIFDTEKHIAAGRQTVACCNL